MSTNEHWDLKFMGKLKSDSKIIFTKENTGIRFPLKIISNTPSNLPENAFRYLTSFSEALEAFGYIDDSNLPDEERINYLQDFLDAHYMIFKIKSKQNDEERTFYNAFDFEIFRRDSEEDYNFLTIPFIKTYSENTHETLMKLFNNEYLSGNFAISRESDDYPSFVLIGEYKQALDDTQFTNNTMEKVFAFGPIEGMNYSEEFGFKFITEKDKAFYREVDMSELGEHYLSRDRVMFITWDKDDEIRESLLSTGKVMNTALKKPKIEDINEAEFLNIFEEVALSKRLAYEPSNLTNFHTAIKTQSFVILAGMSGTGKSKIVQCYHEALNKFANKSNESSTNKKSKLLFIPVRPFWQDDSDLLGFLDTAQSIYRPGESGLVDFIKEANDNPDECYIVCLDEMNLAKVEHYFSQFLSILELEPKDRYINLYSENLSGRIYNQNDYPPKLKLTENIFFIGTVNVDESTFQFSDKVLDRANIISLDLCPFKEIRERILQHFSMKDKKDTNSKKTPSINDPLRTFSKFKSMKRAHNIDVLSSEEIGLLWDLNEKMQKCNKQIGVGYRIVEQIETYIANLPNSNNLSRREAIDIQLTQRILTKLRGSKAQLGDLIGNFENDEYISGELIGLLDTYANLSDFKLARAKVENLAKELYEYGHTV